MIIFSLLLFFTFTVLNIQAQASKVYKFSVGTVISPQIGVSGSISTGKYNYQLVLRQRDKLPVGIVFKYRESNSKWL